MAELTKKFQKIVKEIEDKIIDKEELEFINKKMVEVAMLHMEIIDEMTNIISERLEGIESVQNLIDEKVRNIQNSISGIESDMYEDNFDFEIICPYCNNEFIADIEEKSSIKCPECQNIIELDWNENDEHECSGSCSGCYSHCNESYSDNELEELFYRKYKQEHKEDDEDF